MKTSKQSTWTSGAALGLVLLIMSATPALAQQSSEAVSEGARVYGATCGRCHNPRSPLERTDRQWVTIINHMRVRAMLTGTEVRNVLAFLQATNTDPSQSAQLSPQATQAPFQQASDAPASTDATVIARGEALVSEKACLGCHVIGTAGGAVGPSLNRSVQRRGPQFIRNKLVNPTFNSSTSMMPNFGLTPDQVEAILAYLATLGRDD